jgi:hypothetical protein
MTEGSNNNIGQSNGDSGKSSEKKRVIQNKKETFIEKYQELEEPIYDANKYNEADECIRPTNEIAELDGNKYKNGGDVRHAIETGVKSVFPKPVEPQAATVTDASGDVSTAPIDATDGMTWKKQVDAHVMHIDIKHD